MTDIVKLIARIARATNCQARSRLIRQLPWSKMSAQSRAIALKYIPIRDGNPDCSNMHPLSRRKRAEQFLRRYEKTNAKYRVSILD